MHDELEAPGSDDAPEWSSLYRARQDEVIEYRPVFTGDVFEDVFAIGEAEPLTIMILQHPCAIRVDGVRLTPRLLVSEVNPSQRLKPSLWAKGHYKQMPLAELITQGGAVDHAALFNKHHLVTPDALRNGRRIACLSQRGVNLLLQRWVHHNSRVIVPTFKYQDVTSGQFEEADLIEDWCIERESDGLDKDAAVREVDEWLSSDVGQGISRRDQLQDEQERSSLRRALRDHLRDLRKID